GYQAMKAALAAGAIGAPLLMHCAHRNPSVPPYGFATEMAITDSAVHEIDVVRWLFEEEIAAASVLTPRRTSRAAEGVQDPLILVLEMASGVLVDDEVFVNAGYGYDIRGEVVGEHGTVALAEGGDVMLTADGPQSRNVPASWQERFARAYDAELQAWLDAVARDTVTGPSAWDGYAAAAVTDAAVRALRTGQRTPISLSERPGLYAKTS
ncbi:MAG: Gfo/Idh/MocA family oxidoreductase, partial [Trebonia sp.]